MANISFISPFLAFLFVSTTARDVPFDESPSPSPSSTPKIKSNFTYVCDPSRFDDLGLDITTFSYCDTSLPFTVRAKDLVDQMTLAEKMRQIGDLAYGVPRIVRMVVVSTEARAMYNLGRAGLTYWSPNINVVRDPRWGRITETPGEDPYTVGSYAANYVRGLQDVEGHENTKDLNSRPLKVSACCKHYAAYDVDNWLGVDRYHFDARVTEQDMLETFLRPFEMCVKDGDVSSVMCSYNRVNGIPTCADPKHLKDTIRGEWDLHGYIVSDCDSIEVLMDGAKWLDDTHEDDVAQVLKAGLDLDCGVYYTNFTENAVMQGKVMENEIDKSLNYLYVVLMRLGFFDGSPSFISLGKENVCSDEHIELAVEATREGIVLLKNDNDTLPLSSNNFKNLAVIGPHANATKVMVGNYAGFPCQYSSPLDAFSAIANVTYEIGWLDLSVEAESLDRVDLLLPGYQTQLINQVAAIAKGPLILVIMSAGGVDISFAKNNPNIKAILWVGYPGGRLPLTWHKADYVDQLPMTSMPLRPVEEFGYPEDLQVLQWLDRLPIRLWPACPAVLVDDMICNDEFEFEVEVQNVGSKDGNEVSWCGSKKVKFTFNACKSLSVVENNGYKLLPSGGHTIMILLEAQHRWLRPSEICEILRNYQKFCLKPDPPYKPPVLYCFDDNVVHCHQRNAKVPSYLTCSRRRYSLIGFRTGENSGAQNSDDSDMFGLIKCYVLGKQNEERKGRNGMGERKKAVNFPWGAIALCILSVFPTVTWRNVMESQFYPEDDPFDESPSPSPSSTPKVKSNFTYVCDPSRFDDLGLDITTFSYCDTSLPFTVRAKDLVDQMTLSEKVRQIGDLAYGVPRIGLPKYEWWSEALHGVSDVGPGTHFDELIPGATSFPTVILTTASFNESLWKNIGQVVSIEARAMYNLGRARLTYWSPNINVVRDPRWGRITETPGEDPYTVGSYATNYVRGLQDVEGQENTKDLNSRPLKVSACCKHYAAYDVDNWLGVDRYHFDARVTEQDMLETFLRPLEMCVKDGDVSSVMCSYNRVNGIPTCADPKLLKDTIRGEWDLHGYIVFDCDSIEVLMDGAEWLDDTREDAVAQVLKAGLDLDCGVYYTNFTENAVMQGKVRENEIDKSLNYLYVMLMRLGFFDGSPSFISLGKENVCSDEHIELAIEAAREGIVLLKNDNDTLPLSSNNFKNLAVIGPHANATKVMVGNYAGIPCQYSSPLDAFSAIANVTYEIGCDVMCKNETLIFPAMQVAKNADATILFVGLDLSVEAESLDRVDLLLPGYQTQLINQVAAVAKGPLILVIMSAGGVDISFAKNNPNIKAILWVGYPGGRLPLTWHKADYVDQLPMTSMPLRPVEESGYPGRTYKFFNGSTVYPFGYGLSYTKFNYQITTSQRSLDIKLDKYQHCRDLTFEDGAYRPSCPAVLVDDMSCNDEFEFEVEVQNVGSKDGNEVVMV
ncbi:hypothetical protein HHK36_023034 [Tetracentron sinense]|uniref:Uncharacterized protein n=1 Tax=Tetracentron sinense TaxID=13715 RepID=A0A834YT03_TETSI|nr:hypothetical protein HHK36_023034 [Tetracentron sinense]